MDNPLIPLSLYEKQCKDLEINTISIWSVEGYLLADLKS